MQLRLISFVLVTLSAGAASHGTYAQTTPQPTIERSAAANVRIQILDRQVQEGVGAGFKLEIQGWESMGSVSIVMVGPKGDQIMVVPPDTALKLDQTGILSLFIPYEVKGLYPGTWVLLAAGKPGIHQIRVQVPTSEAPGSTSRSASN